MTDMKCGYFTVDIVYMKKLAKLWVREVSIEEEGNGNEDLR